MRPASRRTRSPGENAWPRERPIGETCGSVIAIVGGLATAVLWAMTLLGSARSARLIGSWSTLGWVMLIGLAVTVPLVLLTSPPVDLSQTEIAYLTAAGVANSGGLLLVYTALRRGKVGVVGPIVSTEGAIGASFAILAGDPISGPAIAVLALIAVGVVLAAIDRQAPGAEQATVSAGATALLALGGALLFGINLYATSRIAGDLPLAWAVLPARVAGVVGVTIPLLVLRRLVITRPAVPFVVLVGIAEVAGAATYAWGSRESAAIAAVLASQFAGIAAIAAYFLYGERLSRVQVAGVVTITVGVGLLAAVQAL
jgi:drug/metabolite transporter (DMT)-like permease